ncbi:hypothetical protein [Streptomyces sp. NPDC007088]|uniref:hypothetical protein n=1 Tax=Streptomyces sp. NPDC007088 TaxID=3364773 RepID=UPI0036C200F2
MTAGKVYEACGYERSPFSTRARCRIRALGADLVLLNRHEARALLPGTRPTGRNLALDAVELAALACETGAVVARRIVLPTPIPDVLATQIIEDLRGAAA